MLRRNTVIEINIREQATRPLVQAPHPTLPRWQEQRNHIRSPLSADFFSDLLATAAILGVVSVAQAAAKDKGEGSVGGRIIQPLNYERYGNPRFFRDVPQAPNPVIPDDYEGYPHPR